VAVAGPLPGTRSWPAGSSPPVADPSAAPTRGEGDRRTLVHELTLTGDRAAIRDRTTDAVLRLLLEALDADGFGGPAASSGSGI
jgi:hypothetical protein